MKPFTPPQRTRGGFTLIECLVFMGLLVVILGMTLAAWYSAEGSHRALQRNATEITAALQAGEHWRADIRRATHSPQPVPGGVLIPQAEGPVHYFFQNSQVWRETGGRSESVLKNVASSQMSSDSRKHVTGWQWEVKLLPGRKKARMEPLFSFAAVPQEVKR